jgi:aminoglycoside phosphotransferase (APT) family kinase protein
MMELLDRPGAVRVGEELPLESLGTYLRGHLAGVAGQVTVEQFPHGHSNLTYLVRIGDRELVLRRPPSGNEVKTAHDMGREYRVLSRLCKVYPPAPAPYLYCDDAAIVGAPFYVMERRPGIILRKSAPAKLELSANTLHRLGTAFIDNLAQLHGLDYRSAGLGDLGKPEGYVARQVAGWSRRYRDAQTNESPEMDELASWLHQNMPAERGAALVHNDYKFDNLVLDPNDLSRIIGVLDWEMATVGDPLMDLGTALGYWVEAGDSELLQSFVVGPTALPGSWTRRELVERYAARTGFDVSGIGYYYCFGLFKIAVIVQQIYARYVRGHTRDLRFGAMNRVVTNLSRAAVEALGSGGLK